MFLIYFILKPFYLFKSGSPQIADFIMLLVLVLFFIEQKPWDLLERKTVKVLLSFLFLTLFINTVHALTAVPIYDFVFLKASIYYIYNIGLFLFCFQVFKWCKEIDFKIIFIVLLISLSFQYLLVLFDIDKGIVNNFQGREYNFFNNPNQLSYYSLLIITIFFLVKKKFKGLRYLFSLCMILATLLIFSATSIPSMLGIALFWILYLPTLQKRFYSRHLIIILLPVILLFSFKSDYIIDEFNRVQTRFQKPEQRTVNSYSDRGYDRIMNSPKYILYGAGEGNYQRFVSNKIDSPQEIHSTFGNLLFSYGFLGLLLFILFLYFLFEGGTWKLFLYFLPIFLYNFLHNGTRFSLLWILLALVYALYSNENQQINKHFDITV